MARHPSSSGKRKTHANTTANGYGSRWKRLSQLARRIQRFCTDCGATEDLTGEHTDEAWQKLANGQTLTVADIVVLCRSCNSKRGAKRKSENGKLIPLSSPSTSSDATDSEGWGDAPGKGTDEPRGVSEPSDYSPSLNDSGDGQ